MLYIIQPASPKYRTDFFLRISQQYKNKLKIYAAEQDFLGVKSDLNTKNLVLTQPFFKLWKFYWHRGIRLPKLKISDIVVISGNPWVINYMAIFLYCRVRGIKVVWWGQGWTSGSNGILTKIRHKLMSLADAVILYTDNEVSRLKLTKPTIGLNNGINRDEIIDALSSIEKDFSLRNNSRIELLFIGRLTKKSNIEFLLEALSKADKQIVVNVIGDGAYLNEFKELAVGLNIEHKVIWHGALYSEREISKVASKCHYFIYPGSVGLSLIHAFNYSLPAIVHDEPGFHMPEYSAFINGYNGISFEYNDINSLTRVLNELDKQDLFKLKVNAKTTIDSSFNTEDMARRFVSLIQKLEL
ncbi:glycosyltransferase family 4 protein [Vibrio campbellii]|uniref:glycosyltransferase family 4 protein n=1 Tax=Vibrio campbellii TaxID=680 RepID=UPI003857844E